MRKSINRQGVGIIFLFAVGAIVVLSIFLVSQYMSGKSATSEIAASDLGNRANIIAESATEECAYFAMVSSNDIEKNSATGGELYDNLRKFNKNSDGSPSEEGPTGKGLPYVHKTSFDVCQTKKFYSNKDYAGDAEISAFTIGALQQCTFPDSPKLGNESYGVLGFEGEVTVKSRSGNADIQRIVQFAKNFRVLMLHMPYPFCNYTLYLKRPSTGIADRFHEYYETYENTNTTNLPDFPITDMVSDERPIVTTSAEIQPDAYVIKVLDPNASGNGTPDVQSVANEFAAVKAAGFKKLDAAKSSEYVADGYYKQLSWQALKNKASNYYPDFGRFIYDTSKDGQLELSGVYYIEKGLSLDHNFSGRAVLITTSTEDVIIRKVTRTTANSRLCVITTQSSFDFQMSSSVDIHADLCAPRGTIKNAGNGKINGSVYLCFLEPGSAVGPWIVRPDDSDVSPWVSGDLDKDYGAKLGVFISPGYAWKRYWNKRDS